MEIHEITSLPTYGITRDGRVFSKRSKNWHKDDEGNIIYHTLDDWKELVPAPNSCGYMTFVACYMMKYKTFKVHRIVAEQFIGHIPENMVINHINGNKLDNRAENLEIITQVENMQKYWTSDKGIKRRKKQ